MISLSVLVFVIIFNSFTTCDITLYTNPPPKDTCATTLAVCKLDADKLKNILKSGEDGPRGRKGPVGDVGDGGLSGVNGLNGVKGLPGPKGISGEPGVDGAMGLSGDQGSMGMNGINGEVGDQGLKGSKGLRGEKGAAGFVGSFFSKPEIGLPSDKDIEWGSMDNPATETCRDAPESEREKYVDTYYLFIGDLTVSCDFNTNMTCVLNRNTMLNITYNETEPFWLSEKIDLSEMYGLKYDQINWLQQQSYKANLTIRYHCLNSKPVGNDSMSLLLWSDVTIGPETTNDTLFHYTVENDGCSTAAKDEWSSTDIKMVSPIAQRLPIIDFLIKDVGNEMKGLRIEILQLCFG